MCPAILDRVNAHGIELDVCTDHGTWFDAHELDRLIHALRGESVPGVSTTSDAMTSCSKCRQKVRVDRTNLTDEGLTCDNCWRARQGAELALSDQQRQETATVGTVLVGVAAVLLAGVAAAKDS